MTRKNYKVEGMHCASCAASVESMLGAREGVSQARVNFADESVLVEYDDLVVSADKLKQWVQQIGYDLVDVRSVADLQIRAMEMAAASGERFIASAGYLSFQEIAELLRERYPDRNIPKGTLPDLLVRLISKFEPTLKPLLVELDSERKLDNSKARRILEWQPLPAREAVLATADSVIDLKLV